MCGGGGGGDKKIEASRKAQESVLQKTSSLLGFVAQDTGFPVLEGRASETRPRGIAGDRVAECKFRSGDLCSGARRALTEAGYHNEQTLLSLPSIGRAKDANNTWVTTDY